MQKLIELLNKHRVELAHGNLQNQLMRHYNGYVFGLGDLNIQNCVLLIISKEYGFIKWLVENDKIDIDKVIDTAKSFGIDTYYYEEGIDDIYIPLLMVLAVEDNPIEYLLSVIK